MKIIKVNGEELKVPESWLETNLSQWVRLSRLNNKEYFTDEDLNIEILSILCNSDLVSELSIKVFDELMLNTLPVFLKEPTGEDFDHFNIDGIDYAWIEDYGKATLGEVSSIKILLTAANNADATGVDGFIDLLTIILRPAKKITDAETGKDYWQLEKLDIKNLEYRKQLFLERLSPVQIINKVNFFLSGMIKS